MTRLQTGRAPLAGRVVVVACILIAAAFFSILAKGALFPQLRIGAAILATLVVGASILAWYLMAEGIGTFLHHRSPGANTTARLLVGLALLGLWSWVWSAGQHVLSALVLE